MPFPLADLLSRASTRPTSEPEWDVDAAPDTPWPLVEEWLTAAVDGGVLGAGTAVLATATADGSPSARTVLVNDVTENGFWFATSAESPAGRDLAENPAAALVLHLREQSRQLRVTGAVARGDAGRGAAAFRARGGRSQAITLAGRQSEPLPDDADERIAAAVQRLEQDPGSVDPRWTAYLVAPAEIEFWQSRHGTGEVRLRYERDGDAWRRARLWP
ncbi:pyridoxal 5'-phosphate synthase [Amnibacterium sp. CER49]|uniref:pyridoxine/pyridoxamine 5'-phosphate oxidase n=1 Tax=Amnibacterium sp. CER49 TaxID=3039161 RepID=UPI00244B4110|nr:pyridoxal 5'-phosphate synthase [Amnibacterium sp. CER49]MDH2444745.1 pyridoxal 5'-phosphate synthase [Amnibacterium sp. CER49]